MSKIAFIFPVMLILCGCETTVSPTYVNAPPYDPPERFPGTTQIEAPIVKPIKHDGVYGVFMPFSEYEVLLRMTNSMRDDVQLCENINAKNIEKHEAWDKLRKEMETTTTSRAVDDELVKNVVSGLALGGIIAR